MSSSLLFAVDGKRCEVANADPTLTLVDYLRASGFTGAKVGCGEGGCGACTVTIAQWAGGAAAYKSVNACLLALCNCDGLSVTTATGLGNLKKGYHPIQEALADHNGSQCGFCSPGMVMSLFGKLSASKGPNCPDAKEIESCMDGNLCRCTGFRPIISAFQSFAGVPKDSVAGEAFAPFPDFLKGRTEESASTTRRFAGSGKTWLSPGTLAELQAIISTNADQPGKVMSLVCGHTAKGIYKDEHLVDIFVDVSRVPDLSGVTVSAGGIELGAATTWGSLIDVLGDADKGSPETAALPVLREHCQKVAGHSLRNLGTIGGNLSMTKKKGFQSDLATILTGVGATVTVVDVATTVVPLDEFFSESYALPSSAILTKVNVPFLTAGEVFKSYRTAIRPINAHALTNAAFTVKAEGGTIKSARLVFGAMESRKVGGPIRASKAESAMVGQAVGDASLQAAQQALVTEPWWPEDEFERHLCLSYLYKMFHTIAGSAPEKAPPLGVSLSSERPATKGTQAVLWAEGLATQRPIGEGFPKTSSKLQAAGEQTYTDDLPQPERLLNACYVTIPRAMAVFTDADLSQAEKMPGYVGFVGAEDIPGANVCELSQSHKMLVPRGTPSQFAGQPCLMIVADTFKHAQAAAKAVVLKLDIHEEAPLLTVEACLEKQKKYDAVEGETKKAVRSSKKVTRGDAAAAFASATHKVSGEIQSDSQKAFAMEPSTAMAIPGEDSTITVWGTFQVTSWAHGMAAAVTGLPKHKILMNATHMGGGFGGKLMKSLHTVCAASVAAVKFGVPVKLLMDRNIETAMCGGRLPMTMKYDAGFDDTGKITAVKVKCYADEGQGDGAAGFSARIAVENMEQIYGLPNTDLETLLCTTNKPGNTAIRGPGEPQSVFLMESIIEHVAAELGKNPQEVREVNIFTDLAAREKVAANPTSPEVDQYSSLFALGTDCTGKKFKGFPAVGIWMSLKGKADFDGKTAAAAAFNSQQQWRKRGVSMTPVKYNVDRRAQQCHVCLYDDGSVLITQDGSEIGQGLHTKIKQYAAYHLSQIVPGFTVGIEKIRVGPMGSDKVAHGSLTGGSVTSEGVCEAVRDAIEKIAANLQPTREKMVADGKEIKSLAALAGAASGSAELQASGKNYRFDDGGSYHIYGACVSEVELDVLTGETTILSSSILYDCGKSLNPIIDLGQCEGAFLMGVGFFLRERRLQNPETGKEASDGTWEYKIPCFQDVPLEFNVEFFPRAFDEGIVGSKASGEPPIVLATSVFCAVRQAVTAAREQNGKKGHFRMNAPCTPRDIALLIGAASEKMNM